MLPTRPRWLCASAPAKAMITSRIAASRAAPARRRASSDGARRAVKKPIAIPRIASIASIATITAPSWWPAASRCASATPSELSACLEKSHAATAPAPSAPTISSAAPRRRSGTVQNHSANPTASAASAPRE